MRVRQISRHEIQGNDLRPLWRQSDALASAPQTNGAHRIGGSRRPHLVLQGDAQPVGQLVEHEDNSLEKVIYFQDYVVVDPGGTELGTCSSC